MKKLVSFIILGVFLTSCGGKKEEKKNGFEVSRTKTEEASTQKKETIPVDMDNKGVGPIKELSLPDGIDAEMANRGEESFNNLCVACHMIDQRMIGPALEGVLDRRSPEWVMNMMLNPDGMLKEDPIAKALFKEYGNIMLNQNLTEEEARELLEYFRSL